jgi:primosomal protein N' (replication factor Y) (superfamily II helicase)
VAKGAKDQALSARLPVARVAVDISLAHLDRPFDYLVPASMDQAAVPGCRVRVRFAGQLVDGYLLDRTDSSEHQGRLARLERVTSPEPVLTPEIFGLARAVADRYAGTLADVLRLAIPPRHATAEREAAQAPPQDPEHPVPPDRPDRPEHPVPDRPDRPEHPVPPDRPDRPEHPGQSDRLERPEHTARLGRPERPEPGSWARYPAGQAFLAALAEGRPVRAAWSALPGPDWASEIAIAAATTAAAGRGTVIVVPDARDLARVDEALQGVSHGGHVCLTADLGPAERYRRWLAVRRGLVRVVAGTRAAMFAPVCHLGLVVLWDDGDDLHAEPRAPYPHAREVLALRAHRSGAAALIGGFARTAELTQLVAAGWARPLTGRPDALRQVMPQVRAAPDEAELARDAAAMTARLPSLALRSARSALAGDPRRTPTPDTPRGPTTDTRTAPAGGASVRPGEASVRPAGTLAGGPVLVQVPRRGYLAAIACARCRAQARCAVCGGPLQIGGSHEIPGCRWCGALATDWACPRCGSERLRAIVTGAARTAEELGRAFPGVPVRTSGGEHVLAEVSDEPALVIATPGAEPVAAGGYAAALLLDGWALLGRPSLRAAEETLRRWLNAAALARPGAPVIVLADAALPAVQAVIRWDPVTFSERELAERAQLGFPPAVRMAAVTGPASAVADFVASAGLPGQAEVLGPVPAETPAPGRGRPEPGPDAEPQERALIRVPRSAGLDLAHALHAAQAQRSARKDGSAVRVQLDPAEVA